MSRSREFWLHSEPFNAPLLAWLAVHGNLLLALRHPLNRGPSQPYVIQFVRDLGRFLVNRGVLTPQQLDEALQLEREHGTFI